LGWPVSRETSLLASDVSRETARRREDVSGEGKDGGTFPAAAPADLLAGADEIDLRSPAMTDGAEQLPEPPFGAAVIAAIPQASAGSRTDLVYRVTGMQDFHRQGPDLQVVHHPAGPSQGVSVHVDDIPAIAETELSVVEHESLSAAPEGEVVSLVEQHTVSLVEQAAPWTAMRGLTVNDFADRMGGSLSELDDSTPLAMEVAVDTRRRIALTGRRFPHPPQTRILTVANQKGGVGKTTTTVNMAAALAQSGLQVLVLDIDPQGNASTALGVPHHSEVASVYDVLVESQPLVEVIQKCPDIDGLTCAPATIDLAGAEIELVSMVARESRLQRAVEGFLNATDPESRPDYILIDCPPSLGLLTVNAFVAAREVMIPIQCEYYALEGLSQLLRNVELIRGHLNPDLAVSTILLTMYDGRTRLSAQVADEVRSHFPAEVLKTTVPRSVRISEAPSHGQTVMTYDATSSGALSYLEAARELAEQVLGVGDSEPARGRN
jgi:chromosome partitioning protein